MTLGFLMPAISDSRSPSAKHLTLPLTGQRLLDETGRHDQFRAGDSMEWAEGNMKFEWLEVAPLLNLLIESGVRSAFR